MRYALSTVYTLSSDDVVLLQFTVFKHRQMICVSTWAYMDMSVFAIENIIYKMQYSAPFEI